MTTRLRRSKARSRQSMRTAALLLPLHQSTGTDFARSPSPITLASTAERSQMQRALALEFRNSQSMGVNMARRRGWWPGV
jgi:hypothetical protein